MLGSNLWGPGRKTKKTLASFPTSEKKIYTKTMYIFFSEWECNWCFSFFLFSFFCGFFSFFFVSFSFSLSVGVLSLGSCWGQSLGSFAHPCPALLRFGVLSWVSFWVESYSVSFGVLSARVTGRSFGSNLILSSLRSKSLCGRLGL